MAGAGGLAASIKAWTSALRKEQLALDRELRRLERDEVKLKIEVKKAAAKGQKTAAATLAKALVKSRQTRDQLFTSKTRIGSIMLDLKLQASTVKAVGTMHKSTVIMKHMSSLVSVPQISAIARTMSKEMVKAGIIEEMLEDTISDALDSPDIEEKASEEVDKVIAELTGQQLSGAAGLKERKTATATEDAVEEAAAAAVESPEERALSERLAAL